MKINAMNSNYSTKFGCGARTVKGDPRDPSNSYGCKKWQELERHDRELIRESIAAMDKLTKAEKTPNEQLIYDALRALKNARINDGLRIDHLHHSVEDNGYCIQQATGKRYY